MTDEAKKGPLFDAYVLLSEPLQFNTYEIEAALSEDFPGLDISAPDANSPLNADCDTAEFVTHPLMMTASGADAHFATLVRLPGYGTWDAGQLAPRQHIACPDIAGKLARNASYICVSAGCKEDTPEERFRAARRASCLAAVFCKLPTALAVYWEPGDHFLAPEEMVKAADQSMSDSYPLMQWVGVDLGRDPDAGMSRAMSVGMRNFGGFEISYAPAPVELSHAVGQVLTTGTMLLELGHQFNDGDTLGFEGQAPDESMRIRFVPEGTEGSLCDTWLLVHPQSPVNADDLVGPTTSRPAPPGQTEQRRSDMGFFKRLMRGKRDS